MKKYQLKELQSWIKGANQELRARGWRARYWLLAYAFLRGVPYVALERKVHEHHEPQLRILHAEVSKFLPTATEEDCEVWLKRSEPISIASEVAA